MKCFSLALISFLDERSGDSDDSVNTGTNSKISSEAKMKENVQMNKERESLKKTANDNDSLKSQDEVCYNQGLPFDFDRKKIQ